MFANNIPKVRTCVRVNVCNSTLSTSCCLGQGRLLENKKDKRRAKLAADLNLLKQKTKSEGSRDAMSWLRLTVPELTKKLKRKELSALNLLRFYQSQALDVHNKTNCIVDVVHEADDWAQQSDAAADCAARRQLLAGVPISIKDHYAMKGYDVSCGVTSQIFKPYDDDCVIIKVLKRHGAIPFLRTNVPMMYLSLMTSNHIFGSTMNPLNPSRTAGGSSGGESALVAGGGSPLGFGSDLGGSIRQPAALCGIYGFRPTSSRISLRGMPSLANQMGNSLLTGTFGPMARDPDSIVAAMRALWDGTMFDLDPKVVPIHFREDIFSSTKPLRIGYFQELKKFPTCYSVHRAITTAKSQLESLGHELVPWSPSRLDVGARLAGVALRVGGLGPFEDFLSGEGPDETAAIYVPLGLTRYLTKFLAAAWSLLGNTKKANKYGREWTATETWKMALDIQDYVSRTLDEWTESQLDAVICPVFPVPAPEPRYHMESLLSSHFTIFWSLLDCPAGSVPVTGVTASDMERIPEFRANSPINLKLKESLTGSEGLPVGVQVVGMRHNDELVLRLMKELQGAADFVLPLERVQAK